MIARRCGGRGCRAVRTSVGTFSQNSFSSAATIGTPAKRYDAARTNIDQPAKQLTFGRNFSLTDEHRSGANRVRQHLSIREHFRRGNAFLILFAAPHCRPSDHDRIASGAQAHSQDWRSDA